MTARAPTASTESERGKVWRLAFIRNEFGGALGGPIIRNRTFFFGGYQGRTLRQSNTVTTTVPVEAWRRGDLSNVPGLTLYDPATGAGDGTGRLQVASNQIPQGRIHRIAQQLLPLIPMPNQAGLLNNLVVNVPFRYNGSSYDGRIDHYFSQNTRGFAKFNYSDYEVVSEAALGNVIGEGTISTPYTVTGILNLSHNFSPTLLAEFRGGYNRYYTNVHGLNLTEVTNEKLGIRNPNPDPISTVGMARINIAGGMQGIGVPVVYPLINADNLFNFVNTWNKQSGRHAIKWGVDVHRNRMDRFQPQGLNFGPRGMFNFNPGTTSIRGASLGQFGQFANSWAAFLLGAPDQTSRTYMPITPTNRQTQLFTFFHDTFQVSTRLTLDLGVRWELYTPIKPRYAGGAVEL